MTPRYTITISEGKWGRARFEINPLPPTSIDTQEDSMVDQTAWIVWNFLKDMEVYP